MRVRVGYTYTHPYDASLDQDAEWESGEVSSKEEGVAAFRAEVGDAPVYYVIEVK